MRKTKNDRKFSVFWDGGRGIEERKNCNRVPADKKSRFSGFGYCLCSVAFSKDLNLYLIFSGKVCFYGIVARHTYGL